MKIIKIGELYRTKSIPHFWAEKLFSETAFMDKDCNDYFPKTGDIVLLIDRDIAYFNCYKKESFVFIHEENIISTYYLHTGLDCFWDLVEEANLCLTNDKIDDTV